MVTMQTLEEVREEPRKSSVWAHLRPTRVGGGRPLSILYCLTTGRIFCSRSGMTGPGSLPVSTPRRPGTSQAGAGVGRWPLGCDSSECMASSPPHPASLEKPLSLPGGLGESRSPGPSGAASRLLPPVPSGPRLLFLQRRLHPQPPGVTLAALRPAPRLPDVARPLLPPPCLWPKSCPWAPHPRPSAPKSQPP